MTENWEDFLLPYAQAVDELIVKFNSISNEYKKRNVHSPIEQIEGRVKRYGSIIEKAKRKNIPYDEISDKIEDIAGIRIICRFVEDIEKVTEILRMRNGFDLEIMRERDYVTKSKESGYRSFHIHIRYTVMTMEGPVNIWAEIQIRTLAMNFWATIEHSLKYKYNGDIPEHLRQRLLKSASAAFELDREMSKIRDEITEAQKVITVKEVLVDTISKKIQHLHFEAGLHNVDELQREFADILQERNLDDLQAMHEKVRTIAQIYEVSHL